MNLDINQIVAGKVTEMVETGEIQDKIRTGVQKAIDSAIDDQMRSYGGITKQINEAIEKGLKIDLASIDFESYNQQMLVAIKSRLGRMFVGQASEHFMSQLEDTLKPAPDSIDIHDLINQIVECWRNDSCFDPDDCDEYATVEVEHKSYGYTFNLWKKIDSGLYSSHKRTEDVCLYISDRNEKNQIRISHRSSYNTTFLTDEDALIFKLYSAGTEITGISEFDESNCELMLRDECY